MSWPVSQVTAQDLVLVLGMVKLVVAGVLPVPAGWAAVADVNLMVLHVSGVGSAAAAGRPAVAGADLLVVALSWARMAEGQCLA